MDTAVLPLRHVLAGLPDGFVIREHSPLNIRPRSMPEPDVAIIRGHFWDFGKEHPTSAELVVEVADRSLRRDRHVKGPIYAKAGIPEYWILNLAERVRVSALLPPM